MKFLVKVALIAIAGGGGAILASPGGGFISPSGNSSSTVSPTMSPEEMLARSVTMGAQIHDDYQHVEHLRQIARRDQDVIKLNCVNDKLVEIKPQMNVADHVREEIEISRDVNDRRVVFESMTQIAANVRSLTESASRCVGEKVLMSELSNEYTRPDVTDQPSGFENSEIEPPAYASPFD